VSLLGTLDEAKLDAPAFLIKTQRAQDQSRVFPANSGNQLHLTAFSCSQTVL
jgi:hypothetical protein